MYECFTLGNLGHQRPQDVERQSTLKGLARERGLTQLLKSPSSEAIPQSLSPTYLQDSQARNVHVK